MDQPKLVKDIEDRLKSKVVEAAAPVVRFNRKDSESASNNSNDSVDGIDILSNEGKLVSEQVKQAIKKRQKNKVNDHCNWTEWALVDMEVDRKFFDMVEGAAEQIRIQQQNTVEAVATLDFTNIIMHDPLTGEAISNIQELVQEMNVEVQ